MCSSDLSIAISTAPLCSAVTSRVESCTVLRGNSPDVDYYLWLMLLRCRGGITADAIGWLKLWAHIDVGESGEGVSVRETLMKVQARTSKHKEQKQVSRTKNQEPRTKGCSTHKIYPASGPLRKVKPLLQL